MWEPLGSRNTCKLNEGEGFARSERMSQTATTAVIDPLVLWAKWPRSKTRTSYHPVLCHLLDVAAVTLLLWDDVLSAAWRRQIAADFGLDEAATRTWIAFLAGLHDIGKVAPTFQFQVEKAHAQLSRAGLRDTSRDQNTPRHGVISAYVLIELLAKSFKIEDALARRLAVAIGGHHGTFPASADINDASANNIGKGVWRALRQGLAETVATILEVPRDQQPRGLDNGAAMALAGLVSVADWIGSNDTFFHHAISDRNAITPLDPATYFVQARQRAQRALATLGWLGWTPPTESRTFHELFPHLAAYAPLPAQRAAITLATEGLTQEAGIAIIEAPMGDGKTEAALFLADGWGVASGTRGTYIALPTQATSDQMFGRVRAFLATRYQDDLVNLQLLHGHAALSATVRAMQTAAQQRLFTPQGICGPEGSDGAEANVIAAEWFTHGKRAVLAPFGVGTVDQALLAALQTRHVFVRLFGLAAKVVIVDEVHAYDAYMTTLLERLLNWLGALGSPVILLSATLPRLRREALLTAYARGAAWSPPTVAHSDYPRITWATAAAAGARALDVDANRRREVTVTWLPLVIATPPPTDITSAAFPLGEQLRDALADGGCAVVICNTVRRAQRVYRALQHYFPGDADDGAPALDLLHARFLYAERQERERRTLRRFGKPGSKVADEQGNLHEVRRPHRAVLVATQIVEQSLDLDFDLLVTDLAPADLVLQRAGRLQRHDRRGQRPAPFEDDRPLWIVAPEVRADGTPAFERGSTRVYDEHILLRSWIALRGRARIALPGEIEEVVEAVYDDARLCPDTALAARWEETRCALEEERKKYEGKAKQNRILPPFYDDDLFEVFNRELEEDNPSVNLALQALTRLTELSVPVVILDAAAGAGLEQRATPRLSETLALLRQAVTLSDRNIVYDLVAQPAPPGWAKSALLRFHRLIILDDAGQATVGPRGFVVRLDSKVGVEVENLGAANTISDATSEE